MMFNFHTHLTTENLYGIYSHRVGVGEKIPSSVKWFCAGIHPWDVEKIDMNNALEELKSLLTDKSCVGLGEVGLDKVCGTNLEMQTTIFIRQLKLAEESEKKVLIIHQVKAADELIDIKKQQKKDFKWIIHGFNGNRQQIDQFLGQGFLLSVGGALLKPHTRIHQFLQHIPEESLFLETDDEPLACLVEVYQMAAKLRGVELNQLIATIEKNKRNHLSLKG